METRRAEEKRSSRWKKEEEELEEGEEEEVDDEEEDDEEETESEVGSGEEHGRKRRVISNAYSSRRCPKPAGSSGPAAAPPCCQADDCRTDLSNAKQYYRRHKVCEDHAKAPVVLFSGIEQRFCQQCSRFHELSEFDSSKKSCRSRLAGHNERRRKVSSDYHGEGYN